jgi:hypothetical protein
MAQNIGTLVGAAIRPLTDTMPIASAYATEIKGGLHFATASTDRDAIIEERREWGMMCYVINDYQTYQLQYNTLNPGGTNIMDNNNWEAFSGSGGGGLGIKYYVEPSDNILVPLNYQYWIYGDLTIAGNFVNYGQVVIANGGLVMSGGSFSNYGQLSFVSLTTGATTSFNDSDTIGSNVQNTIYGPSVSSYVLPNSLTASVLNSIGGATAGYVLSVDNNGIFNWIIGGSGGGGVGTLIGATNGVTNYGGYVGLGGTFSQDTTIDGDGYDLLLTDFDNLLFTGNSFDVISEFVSLDSGTGSVQILSGSDIIIDTLDQLVLSANSGLVNIGNTQGLVYDGDYTSGFVTHSLITKGYVDSLINSVGATNGLTEITPGVIGLGGTLSQTTIINGDGYDLLLSNFDNLFFTSSVFDIESDFISLDSGIGSIQLLADDDIIIDSSLGQISLSSYSGQVTTYNLEGLVYSSDYSATFVTHSLVTKSYVDSISTGATNGLTNYLGYIGLGGTLSQNTSIDGNGYDLMLSNFDNLFFTSSIFDVESDFISLDSGTGSIQLLADNDIVIMSTLGQISILSTSGQVTTTNLEGLVYSSDYSSTFVTYSLVTKGYVDSISAGLSASGIVNYVPYWTSANTLSSTSSIYDDGNRVGVGTVSNPSYMINVVGDVNIAGTLYATSKSFEIEHPLDSNKRLVYGSLEGPEYGVYHRGKLNNEFVINLPDYWTELVDVDTISVNITPIGSYQRLFVEKIENNKVYIGSDNSGSPRCYYVVYAERKDIPKIIVEQ